MTCEFFDSPLLVSLLLACRILHDPAEDTIAAWPLESGALHVLDVHGVVVCMWATGCVRCSALSMHMVVSPTTEVGPPA